MRFGLVIIFVVCLAAVALGTPVKGNKQTSLTASCSLNCGDKYDPICAKAKNGSKERLLSFGSDCVMANYNCQHADDPYELKSKGECGGNVSVRLS